jgi:hypothetical protein
MAGGQNAVIELAFDPDERPSAPDGPVNMVANLLALALDGQQGRLHAHASDSQ